MLLIDILVLTKQKMYWRSFRGHLKRYPFLKISYFQEWGQDLGSVTPLHRLLINFDWFEWNPYNVSHRYMSVNEAKNCIGGTAGVI